MNMTTIYFVRHAESIFVEGKEKERGLTEKGLKDSLLVSDLLAGEDIQMMISSPYVRAIDTIKPLAEANELTIILENELRERSVGDFSPLSFVEAKRKLYQDFHHAFPQGESSADAQLRSVNALKDILRKHEGKCIAMGTHGDIMTLMLNHFSDQWNYDFWQTTTMPDIYRITFSGDKVVSQTRLWKS